MIEGVSVHNHVTVRRTEFPSLDMGNVVRCYWLCKVLFSLNDSRNRELFRADEGLYLSTQSGLTEKDRTALQHSDLKYLYEAGVSIYLIRSLCLVKGISFIETGIATGGTWPPLEGREGSAQIG